MLSISVFATTPIEGSSTLTSLEYWECCSGERRWTNLVLRRRPHGCQTVDCPHWSEQQHYYYQHIKRKVTA
jgi:hypothetical protein